MSEWPLVGRVEEVRRLAQLLVDRNTSGVLLAAPAGVGKTRLARETLQLAGRSGFATMWVTATRSASHLPLGAFGSLLPPDVAGAEAASADRIDLLRRTMTALVGRAGDERLALFVDDAHLLDEMSATLVHQLALTRQAFIVATVRSGKRVPEPIVALWKDDLVERIDLGGLSDTEAEQLLHEVLAGELDPGAGAAIVRRAAGNVLFLRELLLGAMASGALREERGMWHLVAPLSPSDRLVELVGSRLENLDDQARAVVEVLVCAETLDSAELLALTDNAAVERLERAGIVTVGTDGRRLEVRFAHPLYGDVLRRTIGATTERRVVGALAEIVERSGARRRDDVLRVATWRLLVGGATQEQMLAAARTAWARYDFALGERLAQASLALGGGFDAALLAAQLAGQQGHTDKAEEELRALAVSATTDEQRARVALASLDNAIYGRHVTQALHMAKDVELTIGDPVWRDEIAARRAVLLSPIVGVGAAAAVATDLMARASGRPLVSACMAGAYSLGRVGRTSEAIAAADRGLDEHLALDVPIEWYPWMHTDLRLLALSQAGYLDEAEAGLLELHARMVREGDREGQATVAEALSQQVGVRGNIRTAARFAREAAALCREADRPAYLAHSLARLALALALGRQLHELDAALNEIDSLGPSSLLVVTDEPEARAWAAVATGDLPRARETLRAGADAGEQVGDLNGTAALLHALARLGEPREVLARLRDVSTPIEGPLAPTRVAHTEALALHDSELLDSTAASFDSMGADLLGAEAAADAAVVWQRVGEPRRAAASRRAAAQLAALCEGAVTPALVTIEGRARLSPAEQETVLLAIGGRSNREIAGELHLSVRTVENRLQKVYEKLGIKSREELADAVTGT